MSIRICRIRTVEVHLLPVDINGNFLLDKNLEAVKYVDSRGIVVRISEG